MQQVLRLFTKCDFKIGIYFFTTLFLVSCSLEGKKQGSEDHNWEGYLGGNDRNHHSTLSQINTSNVGDLVEAWRYKSGDASPEGRSQIQCNPLVINGIVYGTNPALKLFAVDGATGEELWKFTPGELDNTGLGANRGVTYYQDGDNEYIMYVAGSFIYQIDAKTGNVNLDFGSKGRVDLHKGLDREVDGLYIGNNSPGLIYKNLFIVGSRVSESVGHVPGHIRAYDAKTGQQKWIFHTIPHPGEEGYDTWPKDAYLNSGGANAWSGMSLDKERGMVFVPTGSASFDFYGGDRDGDNLYANSVVALDATTGEKKWHFQTVHHDLWDRDMPAPPNLVKVNHNGKTIDAVAQITKSAYVFLFDRETGTPLFEINEVKVPQSDLVGEATALTQPIPSKPPQFARSEINANDLPLRSTEAKSFAQESMKMLKSGHQFYPPTEEGTIVFPGFDGGGEWGGAAVDQEGIMYVNSSEMPWILKLNKYTSGVGSDMEAVGKNVYASACIGCHGAELEGSNLYGNVPNLQNLKTRLDKKELVTILKNGKGVMPSFGSLSENELNALSAFLLGTKEMQQQSQDLETWPYPYTFAGYKRFLAPDGLPAINPPWGQLNCIDLNKGIIKWQVPLGNVEGVDILGVDKTGTENYGGPVVTDGGLIFIAAASDGKIRAFDKANGNELWSAPLPAPGFSTPATYSVGGEQYVLQASGGGKLGIRSSDVYVAYKLK